MSINIGLMIWKEMKRQDISTATLATFLEISKTKMQEILQSTNIDIVNLLKISEKLHFNFLGYYQNNSTISSIESEEKQNSLEEIKRLKTLVLEKNKTIAIKDQLIKLQASTINLLEKGQYN